MQIKFHIARNHYLTSQISIVIANDENRNGSIE